MLLKWLSRKQSACRCRRCGIDPWVRKIPWRRKWQPTPVLWLGRIPQRSLADCSPWGHKELDTTYELNSKHKEYLDLISASSICTQQAYEKAYGLLPSVPTGGSNCISSYLQHRNPHLGSSFYPPRRLICLLSASPESHLHSGLAATLLCPESLVTWELQPFLYRLGVAQGSLISTGGPHFGVRSNSSV